MFINTGAILLSETPNQLIGVIAHETGHIKGGHITALRQQIAKMQTAALMLQALSLGAVVGGAATGSSDATQAGIAMMFGGQQVLIRSILSYRRAQESARRSSRRGLFDEVASIARGNAENFQVFRGSVGRRAEGGSLYPEPSCAAGAHRAATGDRAAQPVFQRKDSAQLQLRHDLVRAKILAYTYKNNPQRVLRQYPDNGLPARYARVIVKYHTGGYQAAARDLDELIAGSPQNPWFYELKGTFLMESGNAKEAVGPLRKAVSLASKSGFMRIELAQAMLENHGGKSDEALQLLRVALIDEDQSWLGYRLQSQAYADLKRYAEADLASALSNFHKGDVKNAKMLAERAKNGLPQGSPAWIKADDILNFKMEKVRG